MPASANELRPVRDSESAAAPASRRCSTRSPASGPAAAGKPSDFPAADPAPPQAHSRSGAARRAAPPEALPPRVPATPARRTLTVAQGDGGDSGCAAWPATARVPDRRGKTRCFPAVLPAFLTGHLPRHPLTRQHRLSIPLWRRQDGNAHTAFR